MEAPASSIPVHPPPPSGIILEDDKEESFSKQMVAAWNNADTDKIKSRLFEVYYECVENGICCLCPINSNSSDSINQPCYCLMWCENCSKWVAEYLKIYGPQKCRWCNKEISFVEPFSARPEIEKPFLNKPLEMRYGPNIPTDIKLSLDSMICIKDGKCFGCSKKNAEIANFPCGCLLWCHSCTAAFILEAVKGDFTVDHSCIKCRSEVTSLFEVVQDGGEGKSDPLLNTLEWKSPDGNFQRSSQFYNDYLQRVKSEKCVNCMRPKKLNWMYLPCRCPMFCLWCVNQTIDWAQDNKLTKGHKKDLNIHCALCNKKVKNFDAINKGASKKLPYDYIENQDNKKTNKILGKQRKEFNKALVKSQWEELDGDKKKFVK